MKNRNIIFGLGAILFFTSAPYALGEKPDWDAIEAEKAEVATRLATESEIESARLTSEKDLVTPPQESIRQSDPIEYIAQVPDTSQMEENDSAPSEVGYDAEVESIRKKIRLALNKRDYKTVVDLLTQLPPEHVNEDEADLYERIALVLNLANSENESAKLLQGDTDLSDADQELVNRLYREAEWAFVSGDDDLSKDLLIHVIYVHRRHQKAKDFLKQAFRLRTGRYKVQNMKEKYWEQSSIFFYGGTYERAIDVLKKLAVFDSKNAEVHERLGSAYYMTGQKKEAMESWTSALFLDPDNKTLKEVMGKLQKQIDEDKRLAKLRRDEKKKAFKEKKPEVVVEMQLLGVFPTQSKAYSYAQKLQKEKLTATVEQQDNGKWAVKVPKSEIGAKREKQ